MPLSTRDQVVIGLATGLLVIVLYWLGRLYSGWRIRRWCHEEGYKLIDWRGAWFYEGPGAWFRSENQDAYFIEVEDHHGLPRAGYLVFGSFWWPWPLTRKITVRWD